MANELKIDPLAVMRRINEFDKECSEGQYTDTGDAWTLIYLCRDCLSEIINKYHIG